MQSTDEWKKWKRFFSAMENASTATRRDGIRATRKAAMGAWTGSGIFALLLVASLAYIALGGTLAPEASPIPEPEALAAAIAAELDDDIGGAVRNANVSARPEDKKQ